jgi:hypothetical protein
MAHWAIESFVDIPLNKEMHSALNAYIGYFNTNYGTNYLRYNGVMNPANGTTATAVNSISGQGPVYGNSYPMFGTGSVVYTQIGYLLPSKNARMSNRWMPYASATLANHDRLNGFSNNTFNAGINYFIQGHKSKLSLDIQNRPSFQVNQGELVKGQRLNSVTLQFQLFI